MSEVSEVVVNQMNEVQTSNTVESELANAAYVFQARMGGMERKMVTLDQTMTEQFGQVHDKLDLLMLMAIDEGVTAKVEAQTKLVVEGFKRVVQCLALVLFMQILCYMQNSRHLQQPRETPGWASYVHDRSDLGMMRDGFLCFCDLFFLMPTDE